MSSRIESMVKTALKNAIQKGEAIRLVKGQSRNQPGLIAGNRTQNQKKAINQCLDSNLNLFKIEREEEDGSQFVLITTQGIETLYSELAPEELQKVHAKVAARYATDATDILLNILKSRRQQAIEDERKVRESRRRFLQQYHEQLLQEQQEITQSLEALSEELGTFEETSTETPSRPDSSPATARDEGDLDFQRDVAEMLVMEWVDAQTEETREALARVMLNNGIESLGAVGEEVEFNGRFHLTDDLLDPGEQAVIIAPGWRLRNDRGNYLLRKAQVEMKQSTPQEV